MLLEVLAVAAFQVGGAPAYAEWAAHYRCLNRAAALMAETNEPIAEAARLTVNLCAPYLSVYEAALFEAGYDEDRAIRRSEAVALVGTAHAERVITRIRLCGASDDCEALFAPDPPRAPIE